MTRSASWASTLLACLRSSRSLMRASFSVKAWASPVLAEQSPTALGVVEDGPGSVQDGDLVSELRVYMDCLVLHLSSSRSGRRGVRATGRARSRSELPGISKV